MSPGLVAGSADIDVNVARPLAGSADIDMNVARPLAGSADISQASRGVRGH